MDMQVRAQYTLAEAYIEELRLLVAAATQPSAEAAEGGGGGGGGGKDKGGKNGGGGSGSGSKAPGGVGEETVALSEPIPYAILTLGIAPPAGEDEDVEPGGEDEEEEDEFANAEPEHVPFLQVGCGASVTIAWEPV